MHKSKKLCVRSLSNFFSFVSIAGPFPSSRGWGPGSNTRRTGYSTIKLSLKSHLSTMSINSKGCITKNNLIIRNKTIIRSAAISISDFNGKWTFLNDYGLENYQKSKNIKKESQIILQSPVTQQIITANTSYVINQYSVDENNTNFNCTAFKTPLNGNNWGSISTPTSFAGPGGKVDGAYGRYINGYLLTCYGSLTPGQQRTISIRAIEFQTIGTATVQILYESFSKYTINNDLTITYVPNAAVYNAQYYRNC